MAKFPIHTIESAPVASKRMLEGAQQALGFIPNLFATMAEAPNVLKIYTTLGSLLEQESILSAQERELIIIEASRLNKCNYCVAVHSTVCDMNNFPNEITDAVRADQPVPYAKLEALRQFTKLVVTKRGEVSEEDVDQFLAAGYKKAQVLEVILIVSYKVLANYINNMMHTPLDKAFEARRIDTL